MVFAYLFLGLALAQASVMALRHRSTAARAGLALVAVLTLLDFVPVQLSTTPATCPAALAGIAKETGDFGVLDMPGLQRKQCSCRHVTATPSCWAKPRAI